jgi:single-strand DNA-binding protein
MNINNVIIGGNLTRDPDFKTINQDSHLAEFSVAINRRWKSASGEKKEDVVFIAVIAWGRLAELCRDYLRKGSPCVVIGRLIQDRWEDAEGKKQSKTRVYAESVQFVGRKQGEDDQHVTAD